MLRLPATLLLLLLCLAPAALGATFTVTDGGDAGPGTLRQAILDANATPGRDTIIFTTDVSLDSSLPAITGPVDIDGTAAPSGRHRVEFGTLLDGNRMFLFNPGSDTSTIRNLFLRTLRVIVVASGVMDVTIARNEIRDASVAISGLRTVVGGTPADANVFVSTLFLTGAQQTFVYHNTIGRISVFGGMTNFIGSPEQGNQIGSLDANNAPGLFIYDNTFVGTGTFSIRVSNTISGSTAIVSNQIESSSDYGVLIQGQNAFLNENTITGHDVGVAVTNRAGFGPVGEQGVSIVGNNIYDNGIGIDLSATAADADGPTANDPAPDSDTGGNNLQNYPVLTSAIHAGGTTEVQGTLTSAPTTMYDIELFATDPAAPQAHQWVDSFLVETNAAGVATFTRTFDVPLPPDLALAVSATATSSGDGGLAGNSAHATSEISPALAVAFPGELRFQTTNYGVNESAGTVTINVVRVGGSDGTVTVTYSTAPGSATAGSDYTTTSGTLTFAPGVTQQSFTVPIVPDGIPEPDETFRVVLGTTTGGATLGDDDETTVTILAQASAAAIPTVSEWGLIAMTIGLALLAMKAVRG